MEVSTSPETVEELHSGYKKLSAEIGKVIIGQDDIVKQIFISMICRGHALLVWGPRTS